MDGLSFENPQLHWIDHLRYVRGAAERTIQSYTIDLRQFTDHVRARGLADYTRVTPDHVYEFVKDQKKRSLTNTSILRKIAAVRSFFRHMTDFKQIEVDPFLRIKIGLRKEKRVPAHLEKTEVVQLLDQMEKHYRNPFLARRNRALIEFLYATGCRLSEVLGLDVADLRFSTMSASVLGKGNKERMVYFHQTAETTVKAYLQIRLGYFGHDDGPVFLTERGSRLSQRGVQHMIEDLTTRMNLPIDLHAHLFRHFFTTHMIDGGADIFALKDLLGHESIRTTQLYAHNTPARIRDVYNRSHPRAAAETAPPAKPEHQMPAIRTAAAVLGKIGGLSQSAKKREASIKNGSHGGRPIQSSGINQCIPTNFSFY